MEHDVRVTIEQIEDAIDYEERRSLWIDLTYGDLKKVVKKAGMVRIVARKTGQDRYMVVVGHHLLRAARECGLKEVRMHVTDTEACLPTREDLRVFRLGVEEILFHAKAYSHDKASLRRSHPSRPPAQRRQRSVKSRAPRHH